MKKMLSVIFILALLVGSVSASSAATLIWSQGDTNKPAGYTVGYGPTAGNYSTTIPIDSDSCVPGVDPKDNSPFDCSMPVPSIPVGTTVWFSVKAFNYGADGQACPTCVSEWATPISYTNQGSGQTGSVPAIPKSVRIEK